MMGYRQVLKMDLTVVSCILAVVDDLKFLYHLLWELKLLK